MGKILFLDFDGVLHNTNSSNEKIFNKLGLLVEALKEKPCPIVVSSSWRFQYTLDQLKNFLQPLSGLIINTTGAPYVGRFPRYNEIKEYLKEHEPLADWRALDDSFLEFPKPCPELILCKAKTGITHNEIKKLVEWLMK
jgi:HAD domain in Swiss Army Knife RNA repair proteins